MSHYLRSRPLLAAVAAVVVLLLATLTGYALRTHEPPRSVAQAGPPPVAPVGPTAVTRTTRAAQPAPGRAGALSTTKPAPRRTPSRSTAAKTTAKPPPSTRSVTSTKKGVSAWNFTGVTGALSDVGAGWFYTWAADPGGITAPPGVAFVPMIWGQKSVTDSGLAAARAAGIVLGFNEPDMAGQANMTPAQALDLWPALQATGARLGSPAPAFGADRAGGWFDRFMSGAGERGYRVDFIALHWYGSDFSGAATGQLKDYLEKVYARYHKPIWLTEYALIDFSGSPEFPTGTQQAAFVTASTAMLRSLPYVERYAWFALGTGDTGDETGLYRPGGAATPAGLAYRAAG
jgi:Glycosyl hydrolase catalytic core